MQKKKKVAAKQGNYFFCLSQQAKAFYITNTEVTNLKILISTALKWKI